MTRAVLRQSIWWLGAALWPLLCAVSSCGSSDEPIAGDFADCGVDGACGPETPDAGLTVHPSLDASRALGESDDACFDGQDNDANTAIDCDELSCRSEFRSCCVGRATPECCSAPSDLATLALGACTGTVGSIACPSPGVTPFGSPLPELLAGALHPNGNLTYDSGVVVDAPIAPGRAITVRATLAIPATACVDGCVEAAGVGLTAEAGYGSESYVRPIVGLVLAASRRSVDLVLAGEVASRVLLEAGVTSVDVELTVAPDGEVRVDGLPSGTLRGRVQRGRELRLVVWGHNMNRLDTDGARIAALTVSTSTCDAPATWTERGPLPLGDGAMVAPAIVAAPSVADSATESRLVFEADGRIVLARRTIATANYALVGGYSNAALVDPAGGALHDPELVALPDGSWRLYVATQGGAIAYAVGLAGGDVFTLRELVLTPSDLDAAIVRLDGPTVLPPRGTDTSWHLVVRALTADGASALVHLESIDGLAFSLPPGATLESATLRTPQSTFTAFDRDEVAAPDLFRHAGTVGIAYAGRAGARWSIGLLVSDAFSHVRAVSGDAALGAGAILAASGASADLDALSVGDPDVVVRDGRVELFYAGTNGVSTRLAQATRPSIEGM